MTTVALGQQLIFPVAGRRHRGAGRCRSIGHGHLLGFFRFLLWLWLIGMLAVLFGMTFGAYRRLQARRPGALPGHGRQRAGADRLSCGRQRRRHRRRGLRPKTEFNRTPKAGT